MKKNIVLLFAILFFCAFFIPIGDVSASSLADNIILQLTETHTDSQININVRLVANSGLSAMTLELVYNDQVFEYNGYEKGEALDALDLISTDLVSNPDAPVKFNWFSQEVQNDFSTGRILQLRFDLKENSSAGEYEIGFKYNNGDIVYILNGNPTSKSAVISKAVVSVDGNKITKTEIVEQAEKNNNVVLVLGIVFISVALIGTVATVLIIKIRKGKRKDKNWVKI